MSPEDFTGGPDQEHPEVASSPEAMRPAEQVTLRRLLDIMTDKTKDGYDFGDTKISTLGRPHIGFTVAEVTLIEKGSDEFDPNKIGHMHMSKSVGEDGGVIYTNYSLLDTPDGLHFERREHTSDSSIRTLPFDAGTAAALEWAMDGLEALADGAASQEMENKPGLAFVSEQEVVNLIELLEPLENLWPGPDNPIS